jgi:hypothetical protein
VLNVQSLEMFTKLSIFSNYLILAKAALFYKFSENPRYMELLCKVEFVFYHKQVRV